MEIKIKNASVMPKRYYALHMVEGLAEYKNIKHDAPEPFRVYLSEDVIKKMDASFTGCPVYVGHVDNVDLTNLQATADGYVVKSFFNRADGKHWAEIMIVSDRGHEAVSKGWAVSNAYIPSLFGNAGVWHAMPYAKEVLDAKYEHLAIVPDPRYQESVILTPEDFKSYNDRKEAELISLQNSINETVSKPETKTSKGVSMFKLWNKSEVEKSHEILQVSVQLPRSQREITFMQLVNEMDEVEMKKKENSEEDEKDTKDNSGDDSDDALMNDDSDIDMGDGKKMKLGDLKKQYNEMCASAKKENSDELQKAPALATPDASQANTAPGASTKNSIDTLKNASDSAFESARDFEVVPFDSLATGRTRYGSK